MFKKPAAPFADRIKKVTEVKAASAATATKTPTLKPKDRAPRQPMFRNATLLVGDERVTVAVTNLSQTGARIEFGHQHMDLPPRVTLVAGGSRREAAVVWIRQGAAGLRFVD